MITSVTIGWFGESYTVIPSYVIKDELVDKAGLLTYIAIRSFVGNDEMTCYPSIPSLAKRVRVSENTIRAGIEVLSRTGYVVVHERKNDKGDRTSNVYQLLARPVLNQGGADFEPPSFKNARGSITNEEEPIKKNLPVATLPAVKKTKHSPEQVAQFQALADIFYSRSGKWQHGVKEATALYKLLDYGRDRPEYPALLVEAFWKLHKGELYGMTESEKRWWASIPYVPSRLDAKAVETMMERVEDSNRVSPEYLAQLEKDFPSRKRISK